MKVKLLKDVFDGPNLKYTNHRGVVTPFVKGAVVEMSDTSAKKYIDNGLAEPVKEEMANVTT